MVPHRPPFLTCIAAGQGGGGPPCLPTSRAAFAGSRVSHSHPSPDALWSEWTHFPAKIGASTRLPRNIEISAKVPLQDFYASSAKLPTGLDCGELFSGSHWGTSGTAAGGCEWGTIHSSLPTGASLAHTAASHRHSDLLPVVRVKAIIIGARIAFTRCLEPRNCRMADPIGPANISLNLVNE